ncbi:MAG: UDP-N-acetylmuramate--L-alanine ligase [Bacteroidetes bacterium]|nr:UDP-N-acetylmuramate--L-alanine ligase [Bacteroidota bacterium]MCL1968707.1 UDP-N-acetylmuramate--L-alanine ligase [Bacteroidota bacterium]
MTLDKINTIYFLGIGGIGMSALARFFLLHGKKVYGYDLTPSEITGQLIAEGAHIHFEEDTNQIPSLIDLVVFTPAIPKEHKEYQYFIENNIPLLKRSEVLGMICKNYPTIAVAGTHGKTTTTAMLAQLLMGGERCVVSGLPVSLLAFIGGISKNLGSNFVCEPNFDTVVVEADEFDRSFLTLYPQVAIITSVDADHLDIYGDHKKLKESFQLFANQIQPDGVLVIYDEIANQIAHSNKVTYGFSDKADYQISNIQYFPTKTTFDLTINHQITKSSNHLILNISGRHNALNATAAFVASFEFLLWKNEKTGINQILETFKEKISAFAGVKRRFDIRVQRDDFVYIDDYAHHPAEIKAFLEAVKKSYPTKKLTGVFQPHLYSRTRDFAQEFAEALEILDEVILLDIYPAREKPIEGITSHYLLSFIKNKNKKLLAKEELISYLQNNKPEILLTMGAGDIDKLVGLYPLTKSLPVSPEPTT